MRKLVLLDWEQNMMYGTVRKIGDITVPNYDQLYNFIVNTVIEDEDEWLEEMEVWINTDNEDEIKESIIEGKFESDMFLMGIGEERNIVCMTEERYDTVKHLDNDQMVDYIVNWTTEIH